MTSGTLEPVEPHVQTQAVGWDTGSRQPPAAHPTEPIDEAFWRTLWRVIRSPRQAMVDLGRDQAAARKGMVLPSVAVLFWP
jgi:hypothetical protein